LNPWPPPCERQKEGQNNPFFKNRSLKKYYLQNRNSYIDYLDNIRQIQPKQSKDYTSSLDKKLSYIKSIMDLKRNLEKYYTDPYGKALKNLFNFMEYQEIEEFNGISTEKWKKKIKLKISGVREIYISDLELKEAYQKVENKFKSLFKLLVFSGMRLTQILEGIKNLENIVIKDKIARIPISSLSKGKKKGFWIYFPSEFLPELKMLETKYCYYTYTKCTVN